MTVDSQDEEWLKMREVVHKIAEFVALFESAEEKLIERENSLEKKLQLSQEYVDDQIIKMKVILADFQEIMTEAGAARWRQSALKNEEYLEKIRLATDEFIRCSDECFKRLNKATEYTVKGLSKTLHSFRMDDFQIAANTSIELVRSACQKSIKKINEVIRWFHWRNIALVFSITIVATMVTGLYMNDEWPWESHQQVMQQRQLALAVEAAWPHLSAVDQQEILHTATENIA